jgi:hypothetical protein
VALLVVRSVQLRAKRISCGFLQVKPVIRN